MDITIFRITPILRNNIFTYRCDANHIRLHTSTRRYTITREGCTRDASTRRLDATLATARERHTAGHRAHECTVSSNPSRVNVSSNRLV